MKFSNNVEQFFSSVTSNTTTSVYNAFLNRFGKAVVCFLQKKTTDDEIYILFHKNYSDKLKEHIQLYQKLSKIAFVLTEHSVFFSTVRATTPSAKFSLNLEHGEVLFSTGQQKYVKDDMAFLRYRLSHNLPLQGYDFDNEMILNVSEKYVSFEKGCFLGQEVVARVKNLSKPVKKLVPGISCSFFFNE